MDSNPRILQVQVEAMAMGNTARRMEETMAVRLQVIARRLCT